MKFKKFSDAIINKENRLNSVDITKIGDTDVF